MTAYFTTDFASFVADGDSITTTVDGIEFTARLVFDPDTSPRDYDAPGWVFDTSDPEHGATARAIIDAWSNDEWRYFSVVLDASRDGWEKTGIASLSGIEGNFPSGDENPNLYFREAANILLDEALDAVKASLANLAKES